MQNLKDTSQALDLGKLQGFLQASSQAEISAEKALVRAQDTRDRARALRAKVEQALRDATRAVLG